VKSIVFKPPIRLLHGGKVYLVDVEPPFVLVVRYSR